MVLTHYHEDHANGLAALFARVDVDTIYLADIDAGEGDRDEVEALAERYGVNIHYVTEMTDVENGASTMMIYPPLGEKGANELGLTILCSLGDFDTLITGDMDAKTETKLVETVVLLSHKKADSYIHIDVEFGEGEGKIPVDSIAKRAEAYKPKEKVTYKMIKEYIEAKYGFKVHTAYIAEVKRNLGLPMYDAPNAVEELKQPRKHPTPEKVEAIKDALRYFAVI